MHRFAPALCTLGLAAGLATAARADDAPRRMIPGTAPVAPVIFASTGNGDVLIVGDGGSEVRYVARVHARVQADADVVRVEVRRDGDTEHIAVRTNDERRWSFFTFGRGLSVDLEVHVPRTVAVRGETGNGGVVIRDVGGPAGAETGNGNVQLENVAGTVRASTGNGDVAIGLIPAWHGTGIRVRTGHGNIRIATSGVALRFDAKTAMGEVHVPPSASGAAVSLRSGMGDILAATR